MDSANALHEGSPLAFYLISSAIFLASNLITHFVTRWSSRRQDRASVNLSNQQIHESQTREDYTRAQTIQTLSMTVDEIAVQLKTAIDNLKQKESSIELLELQVERAKRAGYLDEVDRMGNPAASRPA